MQIVQLIRISNPELDSICMHGFKGVYMIPGLWDKNLSFLHDFGGINCRATPQEIINTILQLRLNETQKIVLLRNVEFMIEEVYRIGQYIHEVNAFNEGLIQIAETINYLKEMSGLSEEEIMSLALETISLNNTVRFADEDDIPY